ncbi:hypothetical protein M409DRAFT_21175 [Zasmidium cellare ATCC 36951]|uniref:Uncharacterized protein n=1 Tax=Zasmidium cellare ATCC 36951 TaxID=1080233 RepID=A0A6A6CMP8_ZASCE|nr:uncharacterized protein M409DRAFT_21175 [Zasmidium cellare ATCC 36951]KAF2168425.1 hypothetical protein M409DRAFT_21175 [Zasmidium cellare ATCC 36951]
MKDIFVGASLVLVCIGPHENGSEKVVAIATEMENAVMAAALEEGKDVYQLNHVVLGPWYHKHWTRCIEALQKEETIRLRNALMSFMDRPYWTRLWILQEVAAADRKLQVLCGSSTMSWLGVYLLLELREMGNFPSAPSILGDQVQQWLRYWKKWIADLWSDRRLATLDIEGALDLASDRLCNDPRDRVYGLLGFIDWSVSDAPLLPDYDKTVVQLAIDVLERIGDLRATRKTLVPLEVFAGNEAMRQLRQRSQQGARTCTNRKLMKWAYFTGIQLRTSKGEDELPGKGISLGTPGDRLDESQIPGSIKGMLEDHYQSHPESDLKPLAVGSQVVGFAGHETQVDDVLAYPEIFRHNEQIFLVLRHRPENNFDVVGQGFLVGRHTWKSLAAVTHWKDKEDFMTFSVDMTAEDAVLFIGQDLIIDEDGTERYDLEARFERLAVNPIGQPGGAGFFQALTDA